MPAAIRQDREQARRGGELDRRHEVVSCRYSLTCITPLWQTRSAKPSRECRRKHDTRVAIQTCRAHIRRQAASSLWLPPEKTSLFAPNNSAITTRTIPFVPPGVCHRHSSGRMGVSDAGRCRSCRLRVVVPASSVVREWPEICLPAPAAVTRYARARPPGVRRAPGSDRDVGRKRHGRTRPFVARCGQLVEPDSSPGVSRTSGLVVSCDIGRGRHGGRGGAARRCQASGP